MWGLVDRAIGLENLGFNSQWCVRGEVLGTVLIPSSNNGYLAE